MTKQEADAWNEDCAGFVKFFERVEQYEKHLNNGKKLSFDEEKEDMKVFNKWYKERFKEK
jgi:hypothetical protein